MIATAGDLTPAHRAALADVRLLLSAGAPVPISVLRAVAEVMPNAEPHTPYGMTEALPVADITLGRDRSRGRGERRLRRPSPRRGRRARSARSTTRAAPRAS